MAFISFQKKQKPKKPKNGNRKLPRRLRRSGRHDVTEVRGQTKLTMSYGGLDAHTRARAPILWTKVELTSGVAWWFWGPLVECSRGTRGLP